MFNKITIIGRLGQNAEARTAQNNRDYTIFNVATQEYWKNDKGEYEPAPNGTASLLGASSPSSPARCRKASSSR